MLRIHIGSCPLELATRKRKLQENHALALLRCTSYGVGGAGVCDSWRGMRGLSGIRLFSPSCIFFVMKKHNFTNMDRGEKKTKYLRWLEMLDMELNSIRAVSSGGLKLAFLYVLYDVQRLREMFAQVKEQVKTSNDTYELLEIDEDVDYSTWARKLRTFDTKIYLVADDQAHSRELKNIKKSLWGVADSLVTLPGEKDIDKEEFVRKMEALLWDRVGDEHLRQTLSKHLGELCKELEGIANEMYQRKLNKADGEKLFETLNRRFDWEWGIQVMNDWKTWIDEWEDDEDNSVLLRHAPGKKYDEMLELFKSGFLNPKLKRQMEADMADFEGEIRFECFENVPEGMDLRKHYSALRDLVDLKNDTYLPKKVAIGRYVFNHRKTVREEQRRAFFRFLRMVQRLDELRDANTTEKKNPKKNIRTSSQAHAESLFSKIVKSTDKKEIIIARLHEMVDRQTSPKDIVMPIRAAMEAGVIRRPKWGEFCAEFGDDKLKAKSSLSKYTESSYLYEDEIFKGMIDDFRALIS